MKGGIVICAAGNQGSDAKRYPAAYEPCISVGGIRWDYVKATNSNYGDWITLSAPYGGSGTDNAIYSTYPTKSPNGNPAGSGYGYKSGTSQACPHVAGIAALIISRYGKPGFTPDEVKDIMLSTTRNIDSYLSNYAGKLGRGLVDTYAALREKPDLEVITHLNGVWDISSVALTWTDPNTKTISEYDIYWSLNPLTESSSGLPTGTGVTKKRINNTWGTGASRTYAITDLNSNCEYYIAVVAINSLENLRSEMSKLNGRTLTSTNNLPPVMRKDRDNRIYFEEFNNVTVDVNDYFYDPDGNPLSFKEAVSSNENRMKATARGTKLILSAISAGECNVTVIVTDSNNAQVTGTLMTMARDAKKEVDIYPNPATDKLQIRMGKEVNREVKVQLFNSAGTKVMDTNVMVRPFEPGTISVEKLSSGVYTLLIKYDGKEIKRNFLKY
jgi:hypothetical protein